VEWRHRRHDETDATPFPQFGFADSFSPGTSASVRLLLGGRNDLVRGQQFPDVIPGARAAHGLRQRENQIPARSRPSATLSLVQPSGSFDSAQG
jgi:hypothetical protein